MNSDFIRYSQNDYIFYNAGFTTIDFLEPIAFCLRLVLDSLIERGV